jgi:hypothetical protein
MFCYSFSYTKGSIIGGAEWQSLRLQYALAHLLFGVLLADGHLDDKGEGQVPRDGPVLDGR